MKKETEKKSSHKDPRSQEKTQKIPSGTPQRRKHVRLRIESPMTFCPVPETGTIPGAAVGETKINGVILNLSRGGVLFATRTPPREHGYIVMQFRLNDGDTLTDVVGKVKRVEREGDEEYFCGVEFITAGELEEMNKHTGSNNFSSAMATFDERLKDFLQQKLQSRSPVS